jgi:DNA-binding response OmpR family regulator
MNVENASILIVDDEESIRNILSRRLKSEGYYCETAADGIEALSKASKKNFDLVLTDIKMPMMSGIEMLSRIQTEHPDISVLMITAVVDTKTAVEAMKMGAYDYVTKPFDLDDLNIRVKRALERRKLVLENREYQHRLEEKVEQQVGQIRQYYQEAVQALSREQMALEKLETSQCINGEAVASGKGAMVKQSEISGITKQPAADLNQVLTDKTSEASREKNRTAIAPARKPVEEAEVYPAHSNEKAGAEAERQRALYDGTVELAILPPVSLQQIVRLHEQLRTFTEFKVLNLGGSADKGITIRLFVKTPIPLIKILGGFSEVVKASDEAGESEIMISSRRGETPPVKRIVMGLRNKTSGETAEGLTS